MKVIQTTLRNIDKDLWTKFRQKCLGENVTANSKIIDLIREFVGKRAKNETN